MTVGSAPHCRAPRLHESLCSYTVALLHAALAKPRPAGFPGARPANGGHRRLGRELRGGSTASRRQTARWRASTPPTRSWPRIGLTHRPASTDIDTSDGEACGDRPPGLPLQRQRSIPGPSPAHGPTHLGRLFVPPRAPQARGSVRVSATGPPPPRADVPARATFPRACCSASSPVGGHAGGLGLGQKPGSSSLPRSLFQAARWRNLRLSSLALQGRALRDASAGPPAPHWEDVLWQRLRAFRT